jgi:hypothetical protein
VYYWNAPLSAAVDDVNVSELKSFLFNGSP